MHPSLLPPTPPCALVCLAPLASARITINTRPPRAAKSYLQADPELLHAANVCSPWLHQGRKKRGGTQGKEVRAAKTLHWACEPLIGAGKGGRDEEIKRGVDAIRQEGGLYWSLL